MSWHPSFAVAYVVRYRKRMSYASDLLELAMPTKQPAGGAPGRRSGRVPRNTLSRAGIVDAALALIDAEGLEAVTMPKLAERLGVGTMSLYRHVSDKDDLIDAAAERVMSDVEVPGGDP